MVETRSQKAAKRTRRQIYRSRVKQSQCRGKVKTACRKKNGCKNTKAGKRRSYCRKTKNRRA